MALTERVAIVTGAGGGLGREVAAGLATAGAAVVLVGSDQARMDALGQGLGLAPERWLGLGADLHDESAAKQMVDTVVARFGRVDILIHLVGGWAGGTPVTELAAAEIQAMLDQHLWTAFNVTRALVPHLVAAGWGRVLAVSTPVAADPPREQAAYAIGKAAAAALFGTLAREVSGSGVPVNLVRVRKIDVEHARDADGAPRGAASWTTPEEIAAALLYLCSDAAGAVNGARIPLYGAA